MQPTDRSMALVWIDSREAIIVRLIGDRAAVRRVRSDVPAHRRSTGHVRHDPGTRHGGGHDQTAGETRRLEHLASFVNAVAAGLPDDADLLVLGPGSVRERLARRLRSIDGSRAIPRRIDSLAAPRLTERQLIARLRRQLGQEPRHYTVGRYRWTASLEIDRSGDSVIRPYRTGEMRLRRVSAGRHQGSVAARKG